MLPPLVSPARPIHIPMIYWILSSFVTSQGHRSGRLKTWLYIYIYMKTIFDRYNIWLIFSSGAYIAIYTRCSGLRLFPNHVWCFPMTKLDGLVVSRVSGVGLGRASHRTRLLSEYIWRYMRQRRKSSKSWIYQRSSS